MGQASGIIQAGVAKIVTLILMAGVCMRVTPNCAAASVMVKRSAGNTSSRRVSPGCGGYASEPYAPP